MAERNPWGYSTTLLDPDELERRTAPNVLPEFHRRIMAWARWSGLTVKIKPAGCGGGRRYTQPDRPGFAKPVFIDGRWWITSFHMLQEFEDGNEYYSAWDVVVVNPGGVHRAPTWDEAATALPFGIHFPVSGESWHAQCVEIRGWTTWYKNGRRLPDPNFNLPGSVAPAPLPPGAADYNPPTNWWWFPLDKNKPTIRNGSVDTAFIGHVRYLQDFIWFYAGGEIKRDGEFGDETERRAADFQRFMGLDDDGIVGPKTWGAVDYVIALRATPALSTGVEQVSPCRYYLRRDDSPWRVGEIVYDSGRVGSELLPVSVFDEYSKPGRPVFLEIPTVKGVATKVLRGEGGYKILDRLGLGRDDIETFYDWNGGEDRTLHEGDLVHVPV